MKRNKKIEDKMKQNPWSGVPKTIKSKVQVYFFKNKLTLPEKIKYLYYYSPVIFNKSKLKEIFGISFTTVTKYLKPPKR